MSQRGLISTLKHPLSFFCKITTANVVHSTSHALKKPCSPLPLNAPPGINDVGQHNGNEQAHHRHDTQRERA